MIKNDLKLPKGNLKGIDAEHPFVHHDKNVILKPGNVSLDPQLGGYYIVHSHLFWSELLAKQCLRDHITYVTH